jgi:hypothetical protein
MTPKSPENLFRQFFPLLRRSTAVRSPINRAVTLPPTAPCRPSNTTLQLAVRAERVKRNFDQKRLGRVVLLELRYRTGQRSALQENNSELSNLRRENHIHSREFQTSFHSTISTRRSIRAGVAQVGLVTPVIFSLYVNLT